MFGAEGGNCRCYSSRQTNCFLTRREHIGEAGFFDLASNVATFAEFLRKHVHTPRTFVLQFGGVTLRSRFCLTSLTEAIEAEAGLTWRSSLRVKGHLPYYSWPTVVMYIDLSSSSSNITREIRFSQVGTDVLCAKSKIFAGTGRVFRRVDGACSIAKHVVHQKVLSWLTPIRNLVCGDELDIVRIKEVPCKQASCLGHWWFEEVPYSASATLIRTSLKQL